MGLIPGKLLAIKFQIYKKNGSDEPFFFAEIDFLNNADDLTRQHHGQQGPGDTPEGDVAQRQDQHRQVADEVDALDGPAGDVVEAHGKGVVTRCGAAGTDADTGADADEQGAFDGGNEGIIDDPRPQGRELFAKGVGTGIGSDGQGRIGNKGFSKGLPSQGVADGIEYQAGHGGGEEEPLLQQQGQTQHAAFGHVGNGMDIIDTDCLDHGTQENNETIGRS